MKKVHSFLQTIVSKKRKLIQPKDFNVAITKCTFIIGGWLVRVQVGYVDWQTLVILFLRGDAEREEGRSQPAARARSGQQHRNPDNTPLLH